MQESNVELPYIFKGRVRLFLAKKKSPSNCLLGDFSFNEIKLLSATEQGYKSKKIETEPII
jgi:hypothetical protein